MKKFYILLFIVSSIFLVADCSKKKNNGINDADLPKITTMPIDSVTYFTAVCGGSVLSSGTSLITAGGLCWDTFPQPKVPGCSKTNIILSDKFKDKITGLIPGRTYYARAYATNASGTGYGNQDTFSTAGKPVLATDTISKLSITSATCSGHIIDSGASNIVTEGFCLSTSHNPTISDINFTSNIVAKNFNCNITGLLCNTTYYVRAFAADNYNLSYGNEVTFKTYDKITSGHCRFGSTFTVTHIADSTAPVTKTITYNVVQTNITGESKCWITQNLGAERQANSINDSSEASAGWYWEFGVERGYKHDGVIMTPNWYFPNNGLVGISDPCSALLGTGWRIPTETEWSNILLLNGWKTGTDAFNSVLKLHNAGYISTYIDYYENIKLTELKRDGSTGYYLSSASIYANYFVAFNYNNIRIQIYNA